VGAAFTGRPQVDAFERSREICYYYSYDPTWNQLVWGRLWLRTLSPTASHQA